MHWVTYDAGSGARLGLLDGEVVSGLDREVTLLSLLGDGGERLAEAGASARANPTEMRRLDEVRLLAPIPTPPSVRDGLCFLEHLRGCYRALGRTEELHPAWSQTPAFYFGNPAAVLGPHDDVPIAPGSQWFDFELEVAAVIGRPGRDLRPEDAETHIAGYTFFNDWTARDHQMRDMAQGIGMGKSKDSAITLGPALVTADELEPYRREGRLDVEVTAHVNDREIARGSLALADWSFGELLAFVSRGTELRPGDVIASGTVPGGCLLEHLDTDDPAAFTGWLEAGDVVSLRSPVLGGTRQLVCPSPAPVLLRTGY
ncbi:fumarylacetoacetate hydrolase family protein [Actinomycetospora atypica]|uniref:Fumarylacetoacetate hydrolase family protein n=1 Tax=Actinomycetospora atypica TaxID=1290095 RepID=A0ABV9YRX4_9PSEU